MAKKTWREKLEDDKDLPCVKAIDERMSKRWGEGTFVIPAPREVDAIMRQVPEGRVTTIAHMRQVLARRHGATIACPITTGIFARVAAEAAEEDRAAGRAPITPYWRTLKTGGEVNPKFPGGCEGQTAQLESEGLAVSKKGKRFLVEDFENHLANIE